MTLFDVVSGWLRMHKLLSFFSQEENTTEYKSCIIMQNSIQELYYKNTTAYKSCTIIHNTFCVQKDEHNVIYIFWFCLSLLQVPVFHTNIIQPYDYPTCIYNLLKEIYCVTLQESRSYKSALVLEQEEKHVYLFQTQVRFKPALD